MRHSRLPRATALALSALLALSATAGCDMLTKQRKQKKALAYNEKIVSFNKRISERAFKLGEKIGKRLQGNASVSNADLEAALKAVKDELKAIRSEAKSLDVPDHETARALQKQYMKFLDGQDELAGKLTEAVEVVTKPSKRAGAGQQRQLQGIIKQIQAKEQKELRELQAVQRRFASAHNITLAF